MTGIQLNLTPKQRHDIQRMLSYFHTVKIPVNDGAIIKAPDEGEQRFGAENSFLDLPVLFEDGDGSAFMPEGEVQKKGSFDALACVTHAFQNHIQGVQIRKFNEKDNRSERFTAKMSGTTKEGNSASNVINSIRKDMTVAEERWPFADGMTWDQFYSPIPSDIIQEALRWGKSIRHWPIDMRNDTLVWEAHKRFGTIVVAGLAWYLRNGVYHSPIRGVYGHMFVKAKYTRPGEFHKAFDSYEPFFKELAVDYDFFRWGWVCDVFKVQARRMRRSSITSCSARRYC